MSKENRRRLICIEKIDRSVEAETWCETSGHSSTVMVEDEALCSRRVAVSVRPA